MSMKLGSEIYLEGMAVPLEGSTKIQNESPLIEVPFIIRLNG